jgi:plastocyanin
VKELLPRILLLVANLNVVLVLGGCSAHSAGEHPPAAGTSAASASAVENQVVIDNFTFSPATLTVPAGTKVSWINHDDVPHTATSTAAPRVFDSRALDTDEQFSFVFTTPGTYDYFCAVHPKMTGRIIVK